MLRKVSVLLVSGVLALGGMGLALAQSNFPAKPTAPARAAATPNEVQLAPGGPAGVKEAQAAGVWNYVPFAVVSGLAALVVLLTGNDDDEEVVTTTTTTSSN